MRQSVGKVSFKSGLYSNDRRQGNPWLGSQQRPQLEA